MAPVRRAPNGGESLPTFERLDAILGSAGRLRARVPPAMERGADPRLAVPLLLWLFGFPGRRGTGSGESPPAARESLPAASPPGGPTG
jgi:hypothetical protein